MTRHAAQSVVACVLLLAAVTPAVRSFAADALDETAIRSAVSKSLPLLEAGIKGGMAKRKTCFTCHNGGLPVMALTAAHDRGFAVDTENLQKQLQFTSEILAKNRPNFLAGKGPGGAALTAGFALWTLEISGWKPDANTDAVAEYLLIFQKDLDHYKPQSVRPPSEGSNFTATFAALRGLKHFGTAAQKERIEARTALVKQWILKTPAKNTEDQVFRLWALRAADACADDISKATQALLHAQCEDGGWSQLSDMKSDAYATATALVALHEPGGISVSDVKYRRGLQWLLSDQLPDGSWHVHTRSVPIQTYFESGYPHKEDQFISITAASWATTALISALPQSSMHK